MAPHLPHFPQTEMPRLLHIAYIPILPPSHSVYTGQTGHKRNAELGRKAEASNTTILATWATPFHGHSTD